MPSLELRGVKPLRQRPGEQPLAPAARAGGLQLEGLGLCLDTGNAQQARAVPAEVQGVLWLSVAS